MLDLSPGGARKVDPADWSEGLGALVHEAAERSVEERHDEAQEQEGGLRTT